MIQTKNILNEDGKLLYFPQFLNGDYWFEQLQNNIPWQQNEIKIFGKIHPEPRLTAWFGPPYKYSSISWPAAPIPGLLQEIMQKIQQLDTFPFNAVLLNYYRNGNDSMGWHRDNEKEIDQTLIASISLGAPRKFKLRHRTKNLKHEMELKHGDLLMMQNLQEHWEHAIPKQSKIQEARINLTFRRILLP